MLNSIYRLTMTIYCLTKVTVVMDVITFPENL